jgi:hypothetical protein
MPRILFLSPLPSWRRTTLSRRRRFFLSVVGELGFHYIAVERALLVEQGRRGRAEAVRAVVAAGPVSQPMIRSALFSVLTDIGTLLRPRWLTMILGSFSCPIILEAFFAFTRMTSERRD